MADVDWADWQPHRPAQVRLFTTRGGSWPEKRATPEGAPGWAWSDTVQRVIRGFAGEDPALDIRAQQLLNPDVNAASDEWVAALLN